MDYSVIIFNIVTSSFVVGILTYLIQKRIDKRFNKIEEFQNTLITIRKERYDTLLKTLQEIWEKLIETEYYIRYELNNQVKEAMKKELQVLTLDNKPLKETFLFIEKRSIILDDILSNETRNFFINHLQKTYNKYISELNATISGKKTLEQLNKIIPEALGKTYKKDLDILRKKYEEQARQILYDNQ